jgi:hypothetical protein
MLSVIILNVSMLCGDTMTLHINIQRMNKNATLNIKTHSISIKIVTVNTTLC